MSILEGEIAEQISDALVEAAIPVAVTVTRQVQDPESSPWAPTFTTVDYSCQGLRDSYTALDRAGGNILESDVKVLILAPTLAIEPVPGDSVTIDGKTYSVVTVSTDPAGALWEVQARI